MSLLKIQNLHKTFGGNSAGKQADSSKKAINNISLSIEKGEILTILGESGSGKTTLLHLIAALHEPDAGSLTLDGERITPPSEKLIAGHPDIKLVRQDYGLFPNMTIRENIAYELRYYEEKYRNKRIDKLLKISGLQKVQSHLPRQVSGGEQQRAVIVKAIAEQPKLLLLDEPFSHLDALNKRRLKNEILHIIKDDGVTCIFVTHDVADAYGMADRLVIMQKGKVLQIGTPEEVYQNPINQYVAEITGELALSTELRVLSSELQLQLRTQNSEFKTFFLRPEQLRISETSEIKALVESIKFLGAYYEVILKIDNLSLKMYSFDKLTVGDVVGIEIFE
ncbi:ABC transporter ATP-binding protein [Emticicia sp. SJ17W-69]|uniref:ABC transporter ATP-binding protein n=1 Tax=Emticicia sp. SJ17W-69 TaxID=3421657 RepID=UPI003EC10417